MKEQYTGLQDPQMSPDVLPTPKHLERHVHAGKESIAAAESPNIEDKNSLPSHETGRVEGLFCYSQADKDWLPPYAVLHLPWGLPLSVQVTRGNRVSMDHLKEEERSKELISGVPSAQFSGAT